MGNNVFANGREISCKAADGKSVAAFPDVAFTPPQTPATPLGVPIPYPNTGFAKDTTKGSKSVKISSKEVIKKNQSYLKKSTGDEAGRAPKKGIVTSKITGKVYFNSWSMNVKVEGKNVARHLDLTTHNHASFPGNTPVWPYLDSTAFSGSGPCSGVAKGVKDNCIGSDEEPKELLVFTNPRMNRERAVKRSKSLNNMCGNPDCRKALKCVLTPYSPSNCCPHPQPKPPEQTPHHVVPKAQFYKSGFASKKTKAEQDIGALLLDDNGKNKYTPNNAPCICAPGISHSEGLHGQIHSKTNTNTRSHSSVGVPAGSRIPDDKRWKLADAESVGSSAAAEVTGCPEACIREQARKRHQDMDINDQSDVRPTTAGGEEEAQTDTGFP